MSLQWHSPPQTRVAAWVHDVCGIVPAPRECRFVLNNNSDEMEAGKALLAMYEAELWQLGVMSQAQRRVAALVRNQTGRFPSVQEIDHYLDFAHGSFESAASWLLVEYARQEEREYQESVLAHQRQQLAHIYSQPRPSAPGLGGVDLATEQFLEGGGLGAQMVRNERDVAAVQDFIEGSKLLATDGGSATVPFVDPLSSSATPPRLRRTSTTMSRDLKALAAQPSVVTPHEYIFLGNQRKGAKDKFGMIRSRRVSCRITIIARGTSLTARLTQSASLNMTR